MLQAFGLIVHLEPFHAEDFEEHAFDQVMPQRQLVRDAAPGGGQSDLAVLVHAYQPVFFQAAEGHGNRGC